MQCVGDVMARGYESVGRSTKPGLATSLREGEWQDQWQESESFLGASPFATITIGRTIGGKSEWLGFSPRKDNMCHDKKTEGIKRLLAKLLPWDIFQKVIYVYVYFHRAQSYNLTSNKQESKEIESISSSSYWSNLVLSCNLLSRARVKLKNPL